MVHYLHFYILRLIFIHQFKKRVLLRALFNGL